jgi:hypothetical protein
MSVTMSWSLMVSVTLEWQKRHPFDFVHLTIPYPRLQALTCTWIWIDLIATSSQIWRNLMLHIIFHILILWFLWIHMISMDLLWSIALQIKFANHFWLVLFVSPWTSPLKILPWAELRWVPASERPRRENLRRLFDHWPLGSMGSINSIACVYHVT